jgi:hypothetical protein
VNGRGRLRVSAPRATAEGRQISACAVGTKSCALQVSQIILYLTRMSETE